MLHKAGHDVRVFEASGHVGGRCSTKKIGPYTFDTGATSVAPRGKALEEVMLVELSQEGLVKVEKPIFTHTALRVSAGDPGMRSIERYTYLLGNETLPIRLAEGLRIRFETRVETLESRDNSYHLNGEHFDAVIVAVPLPDTIRLIETAGAQRPIGHIHYRACLSVLLGFDKDIGDLHYHALIDPEQRHPLTWLSIESVKCPGRAPAGHTAMVAQLSPQFSAMHYESEEGAIVAATVEYIERLYGQAWSNPVVADVKRWRYSQPENLALFDNVNQSGATLLIASDGLIGGRVEYAYEAGARAAKLLMDRK